MEMDDGVYGASYLFRLLIWWCKSRAIRFLLLSWSQSQDVCCSEFSQRPKLFPTRQSRPADRAGSQNIDRGQFHNNTHWWAGDPCLARIPVTWWPVTGDSPRGHNLVTRSIGNTSTRPRPVAHHQSTSQQARGRQLLAWPCAVCCLTRVYHLADSQ